MDAGRWLFAAALGAALTLAGGCRSDSSSPGAGRSARGGKESPEMKKYEVQMSDAEWKERLTPEQYHIAREKGTERAFTGKYWNTKGDGVYRCAACGQVLFDSQTKFDSGCGWPSFYEPADGKKVEEHKDLSHGMVRTEVVCSRCGAHLGHVFPDGPRDKTGLRYCINSAVLNFEDREAGGGEK